MFFFLWTNCNFTKCKTAITWGCWIALNYTQYRYFVEPAQPVDLNTTSKNFAVTATTDPVVEEQSYTSILKISNGTTSYSFSYSENSSVTEEMS